jgi:hypothetical protein
MKQVMYSESQIVVETKQVENGVRIHEVCRKTGSVSHIL